MEMSHFEYISVAASLIYSLILAKLLGSLPAALQPGKRYWVHSLWIASLLGVTLDSWWRFWSYREVDWNPTAFVTLLAVPSIIFLRASVLLGDQPSHVPSWRVHYFKVRQPFFLLQLLASVNFIASHWIITGTMLPASTLLGLALFSMLAILAVMFAVPRLHEVIAVLSVLAFTSAIFTLS
jgi:hypothetical protein